MNNTFSKDDLNKFVEFLNFIATKAIFEKWTTDDTIKHFKLLSHMQTAILPKIEANLFEIEKITQLNKPKTETETKTNRTPKSK